MDTGELTANLKSEAKALGFHLVGACPAVTPSGITRFREWLDAGYAGEMTYLDERADAYEHPRHVLAGVRSILMLGMNYRTADPVDPHSGRGRVSRYAWGSDDYHDVIHGRLKRLKQRFLKWVPFGRARGVVDTAPLLEREFARLAGLGWIGKNTLLLNRDAGSWFFLAALLTDVELQYDSPHELDHCGTCTACLDACPTGAFPQPYVLDARKCISYLTIELRSSVPDSLRSQIGDWLFGCDICQEVCPWNQRAPASKEPGFEPRPDSQTVALAELFHLSDDAFRTRFRKTPLWRSKRRGILRNAAIVLGNFGDRSCVAALGHGLRDEEPLVRESCAWALGRMSCADSMTFLNQRLEVESDANVRAAIKSAMVSLADTGV